MFNGIVFVVMTAIIVVAIRVSPSASGLGDLVRGLYFHIACAMVAIIAFLVSCAQSVRVLRGGGDAADVRAEAGAKLGLVFCVLAAITGSLAAHASWGSYWNWDPRETSIALLLLIYLAYFALRASVDDQDRRARLSAVYAILASVAAVFLVFVAPRITESLHPSPIIPTKRQESGIDGHMGMIIGFTTIAFILFFARLYSLTVRVETLIRKKEDV